MKKLLLSLWLLCGLVACQSPPTADRTVDICIYGGTSAGVIAAYKASKEGKTVLLIEPGRYLGGLSSGGLGATDIGKEEAVSGLSLDFYRRLGKKYGLEGIAWHFEPKVATEVFNDYIAEANVEVWHDYSVIGADKEGTRLTRIRLKDYEHGKPERTVAAKVFLDCSYEGDLLAVAGVSFTIGREPNSQYGETYNGVQIEDGNQLPKGIDPYIIPGDSTSGLLWGINPAPIAPIGSGDRKLQAYCYRLCMTTDTLNSLPITRPEGYDSTRYEVLRRVIRQRDEMGWTQRIFQLYLRIIDMPNQKTDINNKGGFSSDMIGMNWDYPEADYFRRKQIAKEHEMYQRGLLYFLATDPAVPQHVQEQMRAYRWPKDEFVDNNHFPHQLYIREARRLIGDFVMTEHHCMSRESVTDGIAKGSYQMDSHNCDRHVINGMVVNEGDVQVKVPQPYDISYRALLPRRTECTNLIVPVCLSASHIAYGTIRMEPVFMMMGEAAALAASWAIDRNLPVQDLSGEELKKQLN